MALPKGTTLQQRYRIEGMLGRGGFAITYLATDLQLKTEVAIKEYLPRQLAKRGENQKTVVPYTADDREHFVYGLKKFLEEAQAIARFESHPNIVNVKGYFEENQTAYMS